MLKFAQRLPDYKEKWIIYFGLSEMNVSRLSKDPILVFGRDLQIQEHLDYITVAKGTPRKFHRGHRSLAITLDQRGIETIKTNGFIFKDRKFPKWLDAILFDYGKTPMDIYKNLKRSGIDAKTIKYDFTRELE